MMPVLKPGTIVSARITFLAKKMQWDGRDWSPDTSIHEIKILTKGIVETLSGRDAVVSFETINSQTVSVRVPRLALRA
jgi:hypothetical protein